MSGEDELLVRRVQKVWRACRIRRKFRALIRAKRALQTTCSVKSAWGKERSRNGWAKLKLGTKAGRAIVHTRELLRIREQSLVRIAQSQAIVEASAASGIDLDKVPLHLQGNLDNYTIDALSQRRAATNHFWVREITAKMWLLLQPLEAAVDVSETWRAHARRHGNGEGNSSIERSLDLRQLHELVSDLGVFLTYEQLQLTMRSLDKDGSGRMEFDEFMEWYTADNAIKVLGVGKSELQQRRRLLRTFNRFDSDKSGVLSRTEFSRL